MVRVSLRPAEHEGAGNPSDCSQFQLGNDRDSGGLQLS